MKIGEVGSDGNMSYIHADYEFKSIRALRDADVSNNATPK